MSESVLLIEKEPPIAWLIFNRPDKHNALSGELWQGIPAALADIENDPDIRVLVVRGAGDKAFSAGADIDEFKTEDATEAPPAKRRTLFEILDDVARCSKPTLAMIHGICMGGGCAAALSVDIRLASEDAVFAITPARLGLGYAFAGIERAVQELGPANARYLFLTAGRVKAEQALHMGIVQEVHPAVELEAATRDLALRIAGNAPKTLRALKESIHQSILPPADRRLDVVEALIQACFDSEDYQEGVRAFREKRTPEFRDR